MQKAHYICDKVIAQMSALLHADTSDDPDNHVELLGMNFALNAATHYQLHLWETMGTTSGDAKLIKEIESGCFYSRLLSAIDSLGLQYTCSLIVGINKGISIFKRNTLG